MNEQVRSYLIEAARIPGKFVFYSDVVKDCNLNYDLSTIQGKKQLSDMLGLVSEFESIQGRPLISSLAIYKDVKINDHGNGFYKIAEQLGKGNFSKLKGDLYGFIEAEKCRIYWQEEDNYTQFANLTSQVNSKKEPDFFTKDEFNFFKEWQLKSYNPKNQNHVEAKNNLMDTVWEKSVYLGKEIVKRLDGFDLDAKKIWSQRGWKLEDGKNVQAAKFKAYTWVKIFKKNDRDKDIFFTFGIDAFPETEAFVYKIDCQETRNSKLSDKQIILFKEMRPKSAHWNTIAFNDLLNLTWEDLIITCVNFIKSHVEQYNAIINAIWGEPIPSTLFKNYLIKRDKPTNGAESIPENKSEFKGVDVDFEKLRSEQKKLGDAGEALVKQNEIDFLEKKKMFNEAASVKIVKDGEGYDILSFDEKGNHKYIEVKTTNSNEYTPFYLSNNEINFMKLNLESYCIYRVYNYDVENNFGEFFELRGDLQNQLLMEPIQYRVFIKKS